MYKYVWIATHEKNHIILANVATPLPNRVPSSMHPHVWRALILSALLLFGHPPIVCYVCGRPFHFAASWRRSYHSYIIRAPHLLIRGVYAMRWGLNHFDCCFVPFFIACSGRLCTGCCSLFVEAPHAVARDNIGDEGSTTPSVFPIFLFVLSAFSALLSSSSSPFSFVLSSFPIRK